MEGWTFPTRGIGSLSLKLWNVKIFNTLRFIFQRSLFATKQIIESVKLKLLNCGYMTRGYRCLIISKRYITSKLFFLWNDCFPEQRINQDKIIANDYYSEPLETALRYISHRWTVHLNINWRTSCPKVIRRRYMTYKGGVFGENRVLFYDKMQRNCEPRKNCNASMMSRWQTLAKRIFLLGGKKCSADVLSASGCISMFFLWHTYEYVLVKETLRKSSYD